ncbi:NrfD/PsrC family molybdoenzyme membrane anchor subunit [Ornithinimicrobium faecis]|uniref:Polysulfide reductase NrfD n=1 Tax=Ornithinimicrobium faecis TaxID=2934158 RepID=A0ABY4YYW8_9MICO|nr:MULTISPECIES: NrfD/PsrC family molybdoenzyme membrane anchor subunit [unclassified Ornithinimicrobium]USQ81797.1 polysulfide reductase NrfD [Ornithinimicrobium sp. HY1793]
MTTSPFDSYRPPDGSVRKRRRRRGGSGRGPGPARNWLNRDGGGTREAPAVPDAEFSSYYGRSVIKPVPWDEKIGAYLFLGGVAAGSGLIATGAAVTGRETLRRNSRLTAMTTVALSGAALVADLGRPERFLNMLRTVKLTSPMSVGTWILSAYATFAGVTTASELVRLVSPSRPDASGSPSRPDASGGEILGHRARGVAMTDDLLRAADRLLTRLDAPASVGQALLAPPLAAYTAVLLSDTVTPVWFEARRQLPFVFVGSAAMASAGLQLVLTPTAQTGPARRLAVLGAATDLIAMRQFEEHLAEWDLDEPIHTGEAGAKLAAAQVLTVAGGLGSLLAGRSRVVAVASGLALATASALTRFGIVEAGIESAKDPKYTVGPQKRRLQERREAGKVHDSTVTVR